MMYAHCWWFIAELLEWEMFQTKGLERIKINILFLIFFCENRAVYEIVWKNIVQPERPDENTWQIKLQTDTQIM